MAVSNERVLECHEAYVRNGSDIEKTAKELGITNTDTVRRYVDLAHDRGITKIAEDAEVILPQFPDDDIDVEGIIDHMCERFEKRADAEAARSWFPITFKKNEPIGIVFFGDPHVDDNGCNWPQLKADCAICENTPGVYGINIGDTTNNWTGRLMKLYAKSDTSDSTARKLAEWFMLDSGVKWLLWLIGNHDAWNDGAAILKQMAKRYKTQRLEMHDWVATFRLVFPGGWEPRIIAAHDFKGHSQWNPLHGPMKAGQMGAEAELFVCGHKHNWAIFNWENGDRAINQTFVRVRGYKDIDEYARRGMFPKQYGGASIMVVFDPDKEQMTAFENLDRGAEYLTMLRAT